MPTRLDSRIACLAAVFSTTSPVLGCAGVVGAQQSAALDSASASAKGDPLPATLTFQADVAPIRALASGADGALWVGSDRGLRRIRLPYDGAVWVGREAGVPVGPVRALAAQAPGRVLIATDAEVGVVAEVDGRFHYRALTKLAHVTHLAPIITAGAGDGIWAGTSSGAFFIEGPSAQPAPTPRGNAVTSLDVEEDGRSAWVGIAGQGLWHVYPRAGIAAFGPGSSSPVDFVDTVGTALLPNGTRLAVGRGADRATRLLLLRASGPEVLSCDTAVPAVLALIGGPLDAAARRGAPLLIAGPVEAPALYRLETVERGQMVDARAFRFSPPHRGLQATRIVALPDERQLPPYATVFARGGDPAAGGLFAGTRSLGVAQLAARGPTHLPNYLPGGELALGARGLTVSCLKEERCVFATGTGPGWIWDGGEHLIRPIPDEAIGGGLMAVAGDGRSTVYFVAAGPAKSLRIARLSSDGGRWEPLTDLPVRVEGDPVVTFATLSPTGSMWMAVRDRSPSGQELGRGVIELQLPSTRAVHHRPYRAGEAHPPEAIPVEGDVAAVRFQRGAGPADPTAIWFCSSLGIQRLAGGQLSQWNEQDGLDSESCHDLEVAADGTVWAATDKGVAWFDGKGWRRFDSSNGTRSGSPAVPGRWPVDREGDGLAARALVVSQEILWAGTARGLWPLGPAGRAAPQAISQGHPPAGPTSPIDRSNGLPDEDVFDLASDRFGRIWVLGQVGLTIRRPLDREQR